MRYKLLSTAWGVFGYVVRDRSLVATFLPDEKLTVERRIHDTFPAAVVVDDLLPGFADDVRAYFLGARTRFHVTIDLSLCAGFRRLVLEACRRIPYGKTASYADLARAVGNPAAVRAVGGTMAMNPLPLVIPCHRVVSSNGGLGGFSSSRGPAQKLALLQLEGVALGATSRRSDEGSGYEEPRRHRRVNPSVILAARS